MAGTGEPGRHCREDVYALGASFAEVILGEQAYIDMFAELEDPLQWDEEMRREKCGRGSSLPPAPLSWALWHAIAGVSSGEARDAIFVARRCDQLTFKRELLQWIGKQLRGVRLDRPDGRFNHLVAALHSFANAGPAGSAAIKALVCSARCMLGGYPDAEAVRQEFGPLLWESSKLSGDARLLRNYMGAPGALATLQAQQQLAADPEHLVAHLHSLGLVDVPWHKLLGCDGTRSVAAQLGIVKGIPTPPPRPAVMTMVQNAAVAAAVQPIMRASSCGASCSLSDALSKPAQQPLHVASSSDIRHAISTEQRECNEPSGDVALPDDQLPVSAGAASGLSSPAQESSADVQRSSSALQQLTRDQHKEEKVQQQAGVKETRASEMSVSQPLVLLLPSPPPPLLLARGSTNSGDVADERLVEQCKEVAIEEVTQSQVCTRKVVAYHITIMIRTAVIMMNACPLPVPSPMSTHHRSTQFRETERPATLAMSCHQLHT
jgi:hypothetical protein